MLNILVISLMAILLIAIVIMAIVLDMQSKEIDEIILKITPLLEERRLQDECGTMFICKEYNWSKNNINDTETT